MNFFRNILKSSKEIIIVYILTYLIVIISALIYIALGFSNLFNFINNYCIYILLIYYCLVIIYLYTKNKKKEQKLSLKSHFILLLLGTSLAVIYNMIIYKLIPPTTNTITLILPLISSGIIGPIFEEILFRYLLFNRLNEKYNTIKAIIIDSIIFAVIHINPIKIVYAFILGIILNLSYHKYKNIKAPILIHMSANIIVLFIKKYNPLILIISIITLIISLILNKLDRRVA